MNMGLLAAEVEQLLQAARLHLAKAEFHEAVGTATEVINRDAKQASAYLIRAEAHRRLKRPERALADLAVAIRLDPHQPGPYLIRAEILKRRNQFDQAIADATHALTIDPRNSAAFSIRAECRSAIGDQDGATHDLHEMLVIDPTRPVPNLQVKAPSGESTSPVDERFWKQSGRKGSDDTSLFADGKPVDKSYRSRRVVTDDDAPEALGVASGYKPGTVRKPIPRFHTSRKGPHVTPIVGAVICVGLLGGGYLLINQSRNSHEANLPRDKSKLSEPSTAKAEREQVTSAAPPRESGLGARETVPLAPLVVEGKTNSPAEIGSVSAIEKPRPDSSNRPAQLIELTELKPPESIAYPSLTRDGLTIFYEGANSDIWTARRKDDESVFQGKERLFVGRHPSVSSDGLELFILAPRTDGRSGMSIHVATRDSLNDAFRRPQEIRELRDQNNPKSPWISTDGLTLLFSRGLDGKGSKVVTCSRSRPNSTWSGPKPFPISPVEAAPTWTTLSEDGLGLYCCFQGGGGPMDRRPNLTIWSRLTKDRPFSNPTLIQISGLPSLVGRSPRYVPATNELFLTMYQPNNPSSIFVIRNFHPNQIAGRLKERTDDSGPLEVKPSVKDLGSVTLNKSGVARIDATADVMKALEGEWLCIAMEEVGKTLNKKAVKEQDRRVMIKGHSYKMKRTENGNRHELVGKFEIDASNGHFDFVGREQGGQSTVWIGIYELNGDTLKLCYRYKRNEDAVRPTEFTTDTDKPNIAVFYTFKRDND